LRGEEEQRNKEKKRGGLSSVPKARGEKGRPLSSDREKKKKKSDEGVAADGTPEKKRKYVSTLVT